MEDAIEAAEEILDSDQGDHSDEEHTECSTEARVRSSSQSRETLHPAGCHWADRSANQ